MATQSGQLGIPATVNTVALNTCLADYQKRLTDNVYNSFTVLKRLNMSKKMVDGGLSIVENLIEVDQDAGGWYLGADELNTTVTNPLTMVEYKWQNAYEPIVVTRDEERANSGDMHKILPLVGTKITLAEKAISKRLDQALSTPIVSANNLNDLATIANTAALGSISGSTDSFWQATVTSSGAFATQGLSDMTTGYYAVSGGATDDNPTVGITNKTVFQKYEDTRLPLERISNGDLTANAGFRNLTFKGIPIIYGNYIGSGLLFLLNENYLNLYVDSATDMVMTEFITPTNQTLKVAFMLWRGNLGTNNRRRHYKQTSIT